MSELHETITSQISKSNSENNKSNSYNILIILCNSEQTIKEHILSKIHFYLTKKKIKIQYATKLGGEIKINDLKQDSNQSINILSNIISISFENINPENFDGIIIPSCYRIFEQLKNDEKFGYLLNEFNKNNKIICAIGFGVGTLLSAKTNFNNFTNSSNCDTLEWTFKNRSITGITMKEMCQILQDKKYFSEHGFFLETQILFEGGNFVSTQYFSQPHIIIDSNLITGQNDSSYNLILKIFVSQLKF